MKVTPELIGKRVFRFYALFHSSIRSEDATLIPHLRQTWASIFFDTDPELFNRACDECERTLRHFPYPADIFEKINAH